MKHPQVIAVLYVLLLVPTVWRTITYPRPVQLLATFVRLTLFDFIRMSTFALRAQEGATAEIPTIPSQESASSLPNKFCSALASSFSSTS
ncbi:hypothetical protein CALVIDRAFT_543284 [Calocera viscosa TUFC12733]|uniref:Uncharacterized protein n=1 Tax=Calocera viscosa (strain TUFC12733) TaxID=1330018 RepID=A0A167FRB0_CALVF|nr:hypothetical protein CALVIDRAFT_543284 [Calocera viscosa TUFC12733]